MKPIKSLIQSYIDQLPKRTPKHRAFVDPFVYKSPFKHLCYSYDLDTSVRADKHLDALDFLKTIDSDSVELLLFDPPYSPRQISENYKKCKKSVNMQTTQSKFRGDLKKQIARIMKRGGIVITCGWNSGGIGQVHGFRIQKILMVAHGSWHNDTIVTVEKCVRTKVHTEGQTKVTHLRAHTKQRAVQKIVHHPKASHTYNLRSRSSRES